MILTDLPNAQHAHRLLSSTQVTSLLIIHHLSNGLGEQHAHIPSIKQHLFYIHDSGDGT